MSRLPTLPAAELQRFVKNPRSLVALVAVVLVPLLYGGLYTWANQNPYDRADNLTGAVVNLDQPVTVTTADGKKQVVPMGRTLTGKLTASTAGASFHWVLSDATDAAAGLSDGSFAAVLTIPKDFSAALTSTSGDPAKASAGQVRLETNDAVNYLSGTMAKGIATAASAQLAQQVTQGYLSALYSGFGTLHDQLGSAAQGASSLASGTAELSAGASQAATGADGLKTGTSQLATGASGLATGAAALDSGVRQTAAGISRLSDGLQQLDSQTGSLPTQSAQLAAGAAQLADGAGQLATSAAPFASGAGQFATGVGQFTAGAQQFTTGADQFATGASQFAGSVDPLVTGASQAASGAQSVSDSVTTYTQSLDALASQCTAAGAAGSFCSQLQALAAGGAGLRSGAATAAQATAQVATGVTGLRSGATTLGSSASQLGTSASQLGTSASQLGSAATQLGSGATQLATGISGLQTGADQVSTGLSRLSAGMPSLALGIHELATGADTAATRAPELVAGADSLSAGATTLASGVDQTATGAAQLAAGVDKLSGGASQAASGSAQLSDGLQTAVTKIPTYTTAEQQHLATVVADPVVAETVRANPVKDNGSGLAAYFAALALWVGALAIYLLLRPLSARALASSASSMRIVLAGYLPGALLGALQGVALAVVLQYAVGISAASFAGLVAVGILTALTFTAMTQALVAAFGMAGRFLGVVLAGLQFTAAGGTFAVATAPAFFQWLHPLLPLTYAVDAFRRVIAGSAVGVGTDVAVLLLWLVAGLFVSVLAARRQRSWTMARLHPAQAI